MTHLDTSLIKHYADHVITALAQNSLAQEEILAIQQIATFMTQGAVYRNASAESRWHNYAKQSIIYALQTSSVGLTILDTLRAENPQLQAEIEAYSCAGEWNV